MQCSLQLFADETEQRRDGRWSGGKRRHRLELSPADADVDDDDGVIDDIVDVAVDGPYEVAELVNGTSRHRWSATAATNTRIISDNGNENSRRALVIHQPSFNEHPVSAGFAKTIIEQRFVQQEQTNNEITDEGWVEA